MKPNFDKENNVMSTLENIIAFINQYEGTAIGESVKNMLDNGESYEKICEYADIEIED